MEHSQYGNDSISRSWGGSIPDKGALSSNSFPNEISRMKLGDDGRDSQSAYTNVINHLGHFKLQ